MHVRGVEGDLIARVIHVDVQDVDGLARRICANE